MGSGRGEIGLQRWSTVASHGRVLALSGEKNQSKRKNSLFETLKMRTKGKYFVSKALIFRFS